MLVNYELGLLVTGTALAHRTHIYTAQEVVLRRIPDPSGLPFRLVTSDHAT